MSRTLSEQQSKELLAPFGIPFLGEHVVATAVEAAAAATKLGFPVVVKLNGDAIAHKTERGLVRLGLGTVDAVEQAGTELLGAATAADGPVSLLVAPMVKSNREFICGVSSDPQFGLTVLLGVGGILAEAIGDVTLRLVPITEADAVEMIDELATQDLLGAFRGESEVDRSALANVLVSLSAAAEGSPGLISIDLNPVLINNGAPVAVDALVEIAEEV